MLLKNKKKPNEAKTKFIKQFRKKFLNKRMETGTSIVIIQTVKKMSIKFNCSTIFKRFNNKIIDRFTVVEYANSFFILV